MVARAVSLTASSSTVKDMAACIVNGCKGSVPDGLILYRRQPVSAIGLYTARDSEAAAVAAAAAACCLVPAAASCIVKGGCKEPCDIHILLRSHCMQMEKPTAN